MAKLSATTVYGKLKSIGETIVQGVLRVRNGIEVEGSESHSYAGIEAGPDAKSGHLMIDSRGGNIYLNWDENENVRLCDGGGTAYYDGSTSGDEIATHNYALNSSNYTPVSDVNNETSLSVDISGDADSVDGYDIQKNGTDGAGIINFKTQ